MSGHTTRKLGKTLSFRLRYLEKILRGEKTTTIRKGILQPQSDEVFLESGGQIYGEARVKSLRFTRVSELTKDDALKDGFNSLEDLLDALKEIYPDIKEDDWVTIISLEEITRYSSPVPVNEIKSLKAVDPSLVARLALAYGIDESQIHRVVLAKLALGYTTGKVAEDLGLPEPQVKEILNNYALKLRSKNLLS
ncbi:MAG: ASCH domain-containing protein [Infirmifilum sp.]|jgi:hypothetical protein|uniref:ASCH domain-containing protein n=1 Tax=Infirmifilum uzonense TaxID=1550241 RepID=UPI0023538BAC